MALEFRALNYNLELLQERVLGLGKKLTAIEKNTRDDIKTMHWFKERQNPVDVFVRISVVSVGDIDTVKQQFVCEFYLSLRWEEPNLIDMVGKEEDIDWREQWEPGIYFVDIINIEKYERNETLFPPKLEGGNPEVMFYYLIRGTFKEVLDIAHFPFDYQLLSLTLTTSWKWEFVSLQKDYERDDNIRTWNFTGKNEWHLQPHVLTESLFTEKEPAASNNVFPIYRIKMHAKRKYGYYLYNVALIMDLITALSFTAYTVDAGTPAERIQISLTLLLTSIALKYVVNAFVPQVPYPTLLDKFIICCMLFQFFMAVQNAISSILKVSYPKHLQMFEWVSFVVLLVVFIIVHSVFIYFWIKYTASAEKLCRKHEDKYNQLKDAVKEISTFYQPSTTAPLLNSHISRASLDMSDSGTVSVEKKRSKFKLKIGKTKFKWKFLAKKNKGRFSGLNDRI